MSRPTAGCNCLSVVIVGEYLDGFVDLAHSKCAVVEGEEHFAQGEDDGLCGFVVDVGVCYLILLKWLE